MGQGTRIGFNIIDSRASNIKDIVHIDNKISVLHFLNRLYFENPMPSDICVTGLDKLLIDSENQDQTSKFIRRLLIKKSNYLMQNKFIIQVLITGLLSASSDASKPISIVDRKEAKIHLIFGSLERLNINYYFTQLNLSS